MSMSEEAMTGQRSAFQLRRVILSENAAIETSFKKQVVAFDSDDIGSDELFGT